MSGGAARIHRLGVAALLFVCGCGGKLSVQAIAGHDAAAGDGQRGYYGDGGVGNSDAACPVGTVGNLTILACAGSVYGIAVDTENVYWTEGWGCPACTTGCAPQSSECGGVAAVPLDGGAAVSIASAPGLPGDVAVDSTSVYWAAHVGRGGSLYRAPLDGGAVTTLASGQYPAHIGLTSTSLYWTNDCSAALPAQPCASVMAVPLDGGTPVTIAADTGPASFIAVGDASVYWTIRSIAQGAASDAAVNASVDEVDIDGGRAVAVVTLGGSPAEVTGLVLGATGLYWSDYVPSSSSVGRLMKMGLEGGAAVTVTADTAPEGGWPQVVASDPTRLYWTYHAYASGASAIESASLDGGLVSTVVSAIAPSTPVAIDSTSLYFVRVIQPGPFTNGYGGTVVMRLSPR